LLAWLTDLQILSREFNVHPLRTVRKRLITPLRDELGCSRSEARRLFSETLEMAGLQRSEFRRPSHLSRGARLRLSLAVAMVCQPAVYFIDDYFDEVDSPDFKTLWQLVEHLAYKDNAAFLIATRDERVLQRCDRRILLQDGSLCPKPA
jgi:putative ABC transport system ATP-binding protein